MRNGKRGGAVGVLTAVLLLAGMAAVLSACNTVEGAGQDVSAVGNTVTTGAAATKKALP